ncbi:MAG: NAD-dependent deacylase [Saprospiraceae bacterium]|uniref:NAD-dependent protein deacylase n=1 Tax=Candidatus Opimibacter skivensis TaxID=2982028 RepID=A0A9D7XLI7_9BACT|nr:NAD-dependent deacylase [Candidatus Opimibacter skivensis]
MAKIVVLTGAGISAESGIKTFRDAGGLWEGYKIEDVATPEAWERQPGVVLEFYNERRRQLLDVNPNLAHLSLKQLEDYHDVTIITQNVDDLHERAGSKHVIHLHGELLKVRSTSDEHLVYEWKKDLFIGDMCATGSQLRPHIVWFGEMVPMLEKAIDEVIQAEIVIIIGSSMQVYPAAGLVSYAPRGAVVFYIDPKPQINHEMRMRHGLEIIEKSAVEGVPQLVRRISGLQL